MPQATRTVARLATICGTALICMAASATAALPKGTLTRAEYQQLSTATAALNKSASSKSINWTRAREACRKTGGATRLLQSQRTSCLDTMTVLEALANFAAEQHRCTTVRARATGTTTTGSTTTGTPRADATVIRLMICMNPRYQALGRDAKAVYTAGIAARKQAVARGFTGSCLATLVPTPADLKKEQRFAVSTQKLAADVTLLIRVTDGRAPASDFNRARIDADVKQFETAATAVLAEHGQQRLSTCHHQ